MPVMKIRWNSPTNDYGLKGKPNKPSSTLFQAGCAKPSKRFRILPFQLKPSQTRKKNSRGKQLYNYAK